MLKAAAGAGIAGVAAYGVYQYTQPKKEALKMIISGGPGAGKGRSSCFEAGLCPPPSCLWQQALQVPMIKQPANKILVNCYWALKLIDLLLTFSPINNHVMFIFKVLEESLSYYQ